MAQEGLMAWVATLGKKERQEGRVGWVATLQERKGQEGLRAIVVYSLDRSSATGSGVEC